MDRARASHHTDRAERQRRPAHVRHRRWRGDVAEHRAHRRPRRGPTTAPRRSRCRASTSSSWASRTGACTSPRADSTTSSRAATESSGPRSCPTASCRHLDAQHHREAGEGHAPAVRPSHGHAPRSRRSRARRLRPVPRAHARSVHRSSLSARAASRQWANDTRRARGWRRRSSAICTALSAAPLRRLSLLTNSASPRPSATPGSWRIRPTKRRVRARGLQRRRHVATARRRARRRAAPSPASTEIGAVELGVDRQRVAGEDRARARRCRDTSRSGMLEDLAALVAELLLLVGLVASRRRRSMPASGTHVEGDRCARTSSARGRSTATPSCASCGVSCVDGRAHLGVELLDAGEPAAGHRLVGADRRAGAGRPRRAAASAPASRPSWCSSGWR